jgi:hypothetical protein
MRFSIIGIRLISTFEPHNVDEVLRAKIDHPVGADLLTERASLLRTLGREHSGAERFAKLDGRAADPAGPTVDEKRLSRAQPRAIENVAPHCEERLGQAGCVTHRNSVWDRQTVPPVDGAIFRSAVTTSPTFQR